ncbi:hypothetical protein [Clostridium sp. Cult2]|uniref:hypothetical protein n=1 Tax=Clostridium sp. Cult2 TaxID=2079003 RepID=UPI001F36F234|nr:hypothetical protein [Clostridium sp. Cult2]MCF6464509.1 hypothetical protein [Clostridium sp. Cult2]
MDDIKLIGSPWITIGVPYNSDVNFMKKVYAGAVSYGLLSDKLHIEPNTTIDYISTKENSLDIVLRDKEQTIQNAYLLLKLFDMYCIVREYIYADLLKDYKYLKKDETGKYIPSEGRESLRLTSKLNRILDDLEKIISAS